MLDYDAVMKSQIFQYLYCRQLFSHFKDLTQSPTGDVYLFAIAGVLLFISNDSALS